MVNDKKRVLVLVPHQDDETNIAGNTIFNLCKMGQEVFIAYSTNGDWSVQAARRMRDAIRVAELYGVLSDHIILLGYGDSYNTVGNDHIFYCNTGCIKSAAGHTETYGAYGLADYSYEKRRKHSQYNKASFVRDLTGMISDLRPDLIICSDFDEHIDHRMLTLSFDDAIYNIKTCFKDYSPIILKSFAYCLAYTAIPDFWELNTPETKRPRVGVTEKYEFDIIDSSIYEWDRRIRFPAPPEALHFSLLKNIKARAMRLHKSQSVILRIDRIINSDEVFWLRRTDSVSYSAKVSVSSGEARHLNDFKLYSFAEINSKAPEYTDYLWKPEEFDQQKSAVFEWIEPQIISLIALYGNIEQTGRILKMRIRFDNGFEIDTPPLPERGQRLELNIPPQSRVYSCTIQIIETEGSGFGLAECEFFKNAELEDTLISELSSDVRWEQLRKAQIDSQDRIKVLQVKVTHALDKIYLSFAAIHWKAIKLFRRIKKNGIRGSFIKLYRRLVIYGRK